MLYNKCETGDKHDCDYLSPIFIVPLLVTVTDDSLQSSKFVNFLQRLIGWFATLHNKSISFISYCSQVHELIPLLCCRSSWYYCVDRGMPQRCVKSHLRTATNNKCLTRHLSTDISSLCTVHDIYACADKGLQPAVTSYCNTL